MTKEIEVLLESIGEALVTLRCVIDERESYIRRLKEQVLDERMKHEKDDVRSKGSKVNDI